LLTRAKIRVSGRVQGIGYRPFVYRIAVKHGLKGYVLNLGDAGVEIVVEGSKAKIEEFMRSLVEERPPLAEYTEIKVEYDEATGEYRDFRIVESSFKGGAGPSYPPPDIATCPKCVSDIFNPRSRYYMYPFTSCTLCGPRFTIIELLPYDRERTTMRDFPMCIDCEKEYNDPLDRRFNAQTICCPKCGPSYFLYTSSGEPVNDDPLKTAAKLLDEGWIVAIKGIGGFHLAVDAYNEEVVVRLRTRRKKPQKPFAVMSRNLDEVRSFAIVKRLEEELLTSLQAPIVLLEKRRPFPLAESVSPGLHNVGVMLPYSGVHHMLFHYMKTGTVVMTSANMPNEPIIKDNDEAFRRLKGIADYILIHNRVIHARCDDSVIRVVDGVPTLIRRSRGYVPEPIRVPLEGNVVAVGGEYMVTGAILNGDLVFPTQHIGDIEQLDTLIFLDEAINHYIKLFNFSDFDAIAVDMHPGFRNRIIAEKLAQRYNAMLVEVQHHHAHLASLMADAKLDPDETIVAITSDGYGYGDDGSAWGGEILIGGYNWYKRVGHLEPQPMPGGDLCAKWYGRMLQSILYNVEDREVLEDFLRKRCLEGFRYGENEIEMVFAQLDRGLNIVWTTSTGRYLDAASCLLGASYRRTYEGEGAMKLEGLGYWANEIVDLPFEIRQNGGSMVLETSTAMLRAKELLLNGVSRKVLAKSILVGLAKGLAEMAVSIAISNGVEYVGFTGGVAYNEVMRRTVRKLVEKDGLKLVVHRRLPAGDGGLSVGQTVVAASRTR